MKVAVLLALGVCAAQAQTTLNLSHDLVSNGIAGQNMVPDSPTLDSRPLFQAAVNYAARHGIATVTADRGRYYFLTQNSPFQHAFLTGINNLTIDFQYSDLYFANRNIVGIQVSNSTNLTLQNFTADYLQLPFTQVTVTSVNAATRTIGYTPSPNYSAPSEFNAFTPPAGYVDDGFFVFDFRNGVQNRGTGRMSVTGPLSDSSVRITDTSPWAQSAQVGNIQAGDTLVIIRRSGTGTILAANCTGLKIQNVSVYASGFIGVLTVYGSGITVDHVQVIPRPGTDRLIATNADGIHLGHAGANNVISNNTVKRGCDDAIAIDGEWSATVNAPNSGATVQVARLSTSPLPIGAAFDFINITNAKVIDTAAILAEGPAPAQQTGSAGELITLTLDHTVPLQKNFGVTASDPNSRGAGSVIRGNLIEEEVFARGIYPAGVANVTVTDNLIHGTNQSGVLVEQDEGLTYGYKTGPSSGITIQNNIIDQAQGFGMPSNGLLTEGGAVNIVAYDQNFAWVQSMPHSDIKVTGNAISNSIRSGIRMQNVSGGKIAGNSILNYGTDPSDYLWYLPNCCETSAQVQADYAQPVVTLTDSSVTNSGNVTTGQWIANVSNADGGFRLAPGAIAVAYGSNFSATLQTTPGQPLPPALGTFTVSVKDSAGVSRQAGLYYVTQGQAAYVVPAGTAPGVATVTVAGQPSAAFIAPVAPGILEVPGTTIANALAARYASDGTPTPEPVFQCSASSCTPAPLDLGAATDILAIELYGTGIRGNSGLSNVVAQIGGVPVQVTYANAQPQYDGLDQVDILVPRSLAGAGVVPIVLTIEGVTANVVTVAIQ